MPLSPATAPLTLLKKLWNYAFGTAFRKGASILTILSFASYALGLVRDMLFSRTFGAGPLLDAYNAAFNIPDLLLNVFVAGALTAAFVPIFTHLWSTGEEAEAEKVATTMLTAAPLTIFILSIIAFIAMPHLAGIVAPGFEGEQKKLLIEMSRLMLISPIIFAISNTIGGMLISYERFIGYGLSPIFYNLGIIAGIPLTKVFGPHGLVVGVIAGAALHLLVRVMDLSRTKFRFGTAIATEAKLEQNSTSNSALNIEQNSGSNSSQNHHVIDFKNPHFLKILKLMIPRMAGQPIEQLTFLIFTRLASLVSIGSVTMLSYARNFQSVPVSLFGIAFSTAIFSSLSRKAAQENREGFLYHFWETVKPLALLSGLSAIFFYFFGEIVIDIFLGGGAFTQEQVTQTGHLLGIFAFAIPAECFIHLLARAFYALKDTWTPLIVTLPGIALIWIVAKWLMPLMPDFPLAALPTSFAIILSLEVLILFGLLWRKI